jgi:hypothetical protein
VGYGRHVTETEFPGFEPVCRSTADARKRLPLGQTDMAPGKRYWVFERPDGTILLQPLSDDTP